MVNFFMTMRGKWNRAAQDVALRFFVVGVLFWALTCVQGVAQSFRTFSLQVHFTNWVIGHSHLAFVADYSFWAFALVYLMVPVLLRRPMHSRQLMEWHFWLTTVGMSVFMAALWIAGWIQGSDWMSFNVPFIETVRAMAPWFALRLAGGLMAGAGVLCMAYNVFRTARHPAPAAVMKPIMASGGGGK
jgi:cytochrome c oxidase cbb3-type subunit 1